MKESLIFVTFDENSANCLKKSGFLNIYLIDFNETTLILPFDVQKVIIFEDTIPVTWKMINLVNNSVKAPVIVVTKESFTSRLYYALGAKLVLISKSKDVGFLFK